MTRTMNIITYLSLVDVSPVRRKKKDAQTSAHLGGSCWGFDRAIVETKYRVKLDKILQQ